MSGTIAEAAPWAIEGARAAVYTPDAWGPGDVDAVTIVKVTATRVTVHGDTWAEGVNIVYAVAKSGELTPYGGGGLIRRSYLVEEGDNRVARVRAAHLHQAVTREAKKLSGAFVQDPTTQRALDAIAALQAYVQGQPKP